MPLVQLPPEHTVLYAQTLVLTASVGMLSQLTGPSKTRRWTDWRTRQSVAGVPFLTNTAGL